MALSEEGKRPFILITNDDGADAAGIVCLAEYMSRTADVVVFAPDGPRSGMSAAITCDKPITYRKLSEKEHLIVYSCSGTPADCVKLAIDEIVSVKPDLLLSGINHGGNQALSVHYSGTIGATFEGCVFGVPSIGVSLYEYEDGADFSEACRIAGIVAKFVLNEGLPQGTFFNLNIPNIKKVKGIRFGRQTGGKWVHEFDQETDAKGNVEYWLTGDYQVSGEDFPDNDLTLLDGGYAAIVPCKVDVTDYHYLKTLQAQLKQETENLKPETSNPKPQT